MFLFNQSVNEYLGKELITKENELNFLYAFKEACLYQIDTEDDTCYAELTVWGEKLPITYELEEGDEGIWSTFDERIAV